MRANDWKSMALWALTACLSALTAVAANADESSVLTQLRANLAEKPTAVRPSLIPGLYGVYFNADEPRTYVDANLRFFGNSSTGYTFFSGPRRGQDLTDQDSQQLFRDILAAIPREKLFSYRFGSGEREVFLFSAYDCPACRALEREFVKQAKTLNVTVYIIPGALAYAPADSRAGQAKARVHDVLCAQNPRAAWTDLILKGIVPPVGTCPINPNDYALLRYVFPVKFPSTVPTAVTTDGHIYASVMTKFDQIFRGK